MATERKSVTVYGLEHAVSAARVAAETGVAIYLSSGEAAAAHAGPAWFRSLLEETRKQAPDADVEGALDCDDFTGYALAALEGTTLFTTGPRTTPSTTSLGNASDGFAKHRSRTHVRRNGGLARNRSESLYMTVFPKPLRETSRLLARA